MLIQHYSMKIPLLRRLTIADFYADRGIIPTQ